jgi:large subunit ribosomal protein L18e
MKSKTKIGKQLERKKSSGLVETIIAAKKNKAWNSAAAVLSGPRKGRADMNLDEISRYAKEGEAIAIPGKVLSQGELDKKIKIIAFAFSERAREKIRESKSEAETLSDEIKKNPSAKGVRFITGK